MTTQTMPREVCISRLPPPLKRKAWDFLQTQRPALAALLAEDPALQLFKAEFRPAIWISLADTGLTSQELVSVAASCIRVASSTRTPTSPSPDSKP